MNQRWRDSEHLLRMAGLFAVGILGFVVLRAFLVPADFGRFGHFRAGALADAQARPLVYAGQQACADCHTDVADLRAPGPHARVACESCHGPLGRHASAPDELTPKKPDGRATCLVCHTANHSKPKTFPQVTPKDHADGGPCIACHRPHDPRMQ